MNKCTITLVALAISFFFSLTGHAQEDSDKELQTIFKKNPVRSSGGYGAISNKLTTINGHYANLVEIYGGWYVNHKFLLGLSASALTNDIPVPASFSAIPGDRLSYMYGDFGLRTEYAIASNKAFHLVFTLNTGAGFTVQYDRYFHDERSVGVQYFPMDENWFFVAEPGIQLEMNIFRWMRFSPGYSYRMAYGSDALQLKDSDISGHSLNLTMKFGKF